MNPDCWIHVFSFLDIGSKMRCESVSRSFHQMIQSSLSRQETIQTKEKKSSHLQGMDNVPDALVNNHALRPSLQALLSKCINLKSISITTTTSNSPDDIIIVVTEHCRKLERLEIRCPNIRVTWAGSVFEKQMQHAWQEMLTKLPHLKSLSLPFCSSHRLSQLLSARDMHEIDLSIYNEPVSEEHLQCVCRNLTKFSGSIIMTESAVVKLMGMIAREVITIFKILFIF